MKEHNIQTIGQLKRLTVAELPPIRGISALHKAAQTRSLPGSHANKLVDHRKADNPYQSLYGEQWEQHINKCAALSPFRPISDLVDFIAEESNRLMMESVHEKDWFFYHDALSLLTSKECTQYMKDTECYGKSIYERWLLPMNDVNINTAYHGKCVGNSPEFMPLDNSLFHDLQSSHRYHCAVTEHLPMSDNRKFSLSTPLRIAEGIKKIWNDSHGAPNGKRIVQDVYLAFKAHKIVYENKGKMVPGLVNRNGHRKSSEGTSNWGGARKKSYETQDDAWLEPGAREVFEERKLFSKSRYLEVVAGH